MFPWEDAIPPELLLDPPGPPLERSMLPDVVDALEAPDPVLVGTGGVDVACDVVAVPLETTWPELATPLVLLPPVEVLSFSSGVPAPEQAMVHAKVANSHRPVVARGR